MQETSTAYPRLISKLEVLSTATYLIQLELQCGNTLTGATVIRGISSMQLPFTFSTEVKVN